MYYMLELQGDFIARISQRADAARSAEEDANEARAPGDTADAEISISVARGRARAGVVVGFSR